MNTQLHFLFSRRSVRAYKPLPIPEPYVRDMLEAAMAAPSAVAKDPWHFIVVTKKETRERIAEALPKGKMTADAPLVFVALGDMDRAHDHLESYMLQDVSAAIENLLLAAHALGLGAVWLGVHPREERMTHLRRLFDLPANMVPVSVVAVGYPIEVPEPRTRYRDNAVHWEKW